MQADAYPVPLPWDGPAFGARAGHGAPDERPSAALSAAGAMPEVRQSEKGSSAFGR
jgi:hypothetical protein